MRISNQGVQTSFKSLLHQDREGFVNDSSFFRDYKTLKAATDEIKKEFPEGAEILDYACSNGEETISLKCLLDDPAYKIIGYDCSTDALKLAKRGVYTVFSNWYDSYLLGSGGYSPYTAVKDPYLPSPKEQYMLRGRFNKIMDEVPCRSEYLSINNKSNFHALKYAKKYFQEKYFKIKDTFKQQIDIRRGNILNITERRTEKPVAAVFFRNALYHLCDNNIDEVIFNNSFMNLSVNRKAILKDLVDKIHEALDKNGIFVIGTHIKDHIFWIDKFTEEKNRVKLKDTPFMKDSKFVHMHGDSLCARISPLVEALTDGGRFVPIAYSKVSEFWNSIDVPTVWKKIR